MLAIIVGDISFVIGLAVMLLPIILTELSRPRDGVWGAVILLLGLVLVTSNDRLRGAPVLAVIFSSALIGRLGFEVAQSRWQQLSESEKVSLSSKERWATSLQQLSASIASLGGNFSSSLKFLSPKPKQSGRRKKWVRPDNPNSQKQNEKNQISFNDPSGDSKETAFTSKDVPSDQGGSSKDS